MSSLARSFSAFYSYTYSTGFLSFSCAAFFLLSIFNRLYITVHYNTYLILPANTLFSMMQENILQGKIETISC